MDLVGAEDLCGRDHVPLGSCDLPAISLRPNHALGLEDLHPDHFGVVGGGGSLDANAMEYLDLKDNRMHCA